MNALVMYDHQTDSLWSQFLGEAVTGSLAGTKLTLLPAQQTTWSAWKAQHPDTLALEKRGVGRSDPYAGYYRGGSEGILGESNSDKRLLTKEYVLGLAEGAIQRAYPFRYLNDSPVLNDSFAGRPVVATFDPESATAVVFDRRVEGRALTFQLVDATAGIQRVMTDLETGSTWSTTNGEGLAGPLAGQQLEQMASHLSFWFAWTDFYPKTELYEPRSGALEG